MTAVGTVTISPPMFEPIIGEQQWKPVDFGDFGTIKAQLDALAKVNFTTTTLDVNQAQAAGAIAVAPPTGAPEIPETTTQSDLTKSLDALRAIMVPGATRPVVPPDVLASLAYANWAAAKNLESFSDLKEFINDPVSPWKPYRVQFVMTANPGWWTIKKDYDAIAHVRFGPANNQDFRIAWVAPAETAQLVEDFHAELESLETALSASGGYGTASASGAFNALLAAAKRLEGIRRNTTLIVSYPKPNEIYIRMRPSLSAERRNQRDLQPTSRVITAIVLVRQKTPLDTPAVPREDKVHLIGQFIPGPRDKRFGGFDVDVPSADAVYSTVRPSEDWTWKPTSGGKYRPTYQRVDEPHAVALKVYLPAWVKAVEAPNVSISDLSASYQEINATEGAITVAITVKTPGKTQAVWFDALSGAGSASSGIRNNADIFRIIIPKPAADATHVGLSLRVRADYADAAGAIHQVGIAKLIEVPIPGRAPATANVAAGGLTISELGLKMAPSGSGTPTTIRIAP